MQAMPVIPPEPQTAPARTEQATPAAKNGAKFRRHLAAATGKQDRQQRAGREDDRTTATTGPDKTGHHRIHGHRPEEKNHRPAPETAAEQAAALTASGPVEIRQQEISLKILPAALPGKEPTPLSRPGEGAAGAGQGTTTQQPVDTTMTAGISILSGKDKSAATPVLPTRTAPEVSPSLASPADVVPDGKMAHDADRENVVVERWSATFSTKMAPGTGPGTAAGPADPGKNATIGQTLVTVQRIPENEEIVSSAPAGARTPQVDTGGQRQDINSSYIHANLPNQATRDDTGAGTGQQPGGDKRREPTDIQRGDQIRQQPASPVADDQPLVFSLDQAGGISNGQGQQVTGPSTSMHQAPGMPVSDAHVMNQVIHHFRGDRQLESGTVVLRLHPQELGELRMEIKVEQDNIKAHITTNNLQVQDILDRHLPRLREALEQQGMNLEQMQVTVATGDNGNPQLFQEHRGGQQARRPVRSIGSNQRVFTMPDDETAPGQQKEDQNLSILA